MPHDWQLARFDPVNHIFVKLNTDARKNGKPPLSLSGTNLSKIEFLRR